MLPHVVAREVVVLTTDVHRFSEPVQVEVSVDGGEPKSIETYALRIVAVESGTSTVRLTAQSRLVTAWLPDTTWVPNANRELGTWVPLTQREAQRAIHELYDVGL